MIGRIVFMTGSGERLATLEDDLTWTVAGDPRRAEILNGSFRLDPNRSPARGSPSLRLLRRAAAALGGTIVARRVFAANAKSMVY